MRVNIAVAIEHFPPADLLSSTLEVQKRDDSWDSVLWTVAQSVLSTPAVVQYGEVNQTGRCLECRIINYITRVGVLGSINKNRMPGGAFNVWERLWPLH